MTTRCTYKTRCHYHETGGEPFLECGPEAAPEDLQGRVCRSWLPDGEPPPGYPPPAGQMLEEERAIVAARRRGAP